MIFLLSKVQNPKTDAYNLNKQTKKESSYNFYEKKVKYNKFSKIKLKDD